MHLASMSLCDALSMIMPNAESRENIRPGINEDFSNVLIPSGKFLGISITLN